MKDLKNEILIPDDITLSFFKTKSKVKVLYELVNGPIRFNKLLNNLGFGNANNLVKILREFEENKIIERIDFNQSPPKVEYSFSIIGNELIPFLIHLHKWCSENHKKLVNYKN